LERPVSTDRRQRDIFPLFLVDPYLAAELVGAAAEVRDGAAQYLNGVIVCLNWLYGVRSPVRRHGKEATSVQRRALQVIGKAACALHGRLVAAADSVTAAPHGWQAFEDKGSQPQLQLVASAVDVPDIAGTCDPLKVVPKDVASQLSDISTFFPHPVAGLERFSSFYAGPRTEYIALVVRQLRAGLLRLAPRCRGGGTVFPVGKAGGRQRAVLHGARVSDAAARPPAPRHLANPSVLPFIALADQAQLRLTKRDCRCWFDQLRLPRALRAYMARPPLTRHELLAGGLSDDDITAYSTEGFDGAHSDGRLFPLGQTWQMGFSWSSYVAQETLLGIASDAGLASDHALAPDRDCIPDMASAFALATDDLMLFSDQGPGVTLAMAKRLEDSMARHGAIKHGDKDLDDVVNGVCIGVELVDGRSWWPPGARLWELIEAVVDLAAHPRASAAAVGAFMGVAQWFDLLRRLKLATFADVYRFVGNATDWTVTDVPPGVVTELVVDTVLAAFASVDMGLPHLGFVGATDASTVYGHGAAVAPMDEQRLNEIAQLAAKFGEHVELSTASEARPRQLLSRPHHLNLGLHDFEVVFSVRVECPRHINLEEAEALLHFVRWVLRSPARFGRRLVVLLDSRVVVGAVGKGRSGSVPLNRLLRRLAALTFAGGLALFVVFIPTAHNPADHPSRGGPDTWPGALRAASRSGVVGGARRVRKLARSEAHRARGPAGRLGRLLNELDEREELLGSLSADLGPYWVPAASRRV